MARALWIVVMIASGLALAGNACAQQSETVQAEATQTDGPKKLNPFTGDSAAIAEGKKLWFKYNCYGCHGTQGGGGMGASLTDATWVHGADDQSVFNVIQKGAGRMPALGEIANISEEETWKLIAFVRSLYKGDPDKVVW